MSSNRMYAQYPNFTVFPDTLEFLAVKQYKTVEEATKSLLMPNEDCDKYKKLRYAIYLMSYALNQENRIKLGIYTAQQASHVFSTWDPSEKCLSNIVKAVERYSMDESIENYGQIKVAMSDSEELLKKINRVPRHVRLSIRSILNLGGICSCHMHTDISSYFSTYYSISSQSETDFDSIKDIDDNDRIEKYNISSFLIFKEILDRDINYGLELLKTQIDPYKDIFEEFNFVEKIKEQYNTISELNSILTIKKEIINMCR